MMELYFDPWGFLGLEAAEWVLRKVVQSGQAPDSDLVLTLTALRAEHLLLEAQERDCPALESVAHQLAQWGEAALKERSERAATLEPSS